MLPIGPFVVCSFGGVSTRLAVSVLQCCVVCVSEDMSMVPQALKTGGRREAG